MKPETQKQTLSKNTSFVAQTVNTSWFQTDMHQHIEYELILFTQGSGVAYIGEYEGKYEAGDIYFIGSNLPHAFKSSDSRPVSGEVIQLRDNCWGTHFINMPECGPIKQLLETSANGLKIVGNRKHTLGSQIKALITATNINRIVLLLQCLEIMSTEKECIILNKKKEKRLITRDMPIDKVVEFTLASFYNRIPLSHVSQLACMSISSFCHYFKRQMHKTYTDYLNEVRIDYACNQLRQTDKPVTEIGYESGYNTVAYFHRQFLRIKNITPLQYRKAFSAEKNLQKSGC
jgi:AraC-like DNA-binding protein